MRDEDVTDGGDRKLILLLKAYQCEDHANQFLDGILHCNTLSYHRARDDQEGVSFIVRSDLSSLRLNDIDVTNDIVSLSHKTNMADFINVFCMFAWAPPFVDDAGKKRLEFNKEAQLGFLRDLEDAYGPYTVVIDPHKISEFVQRLRRVVERPDSGVVRGRSGLVRYVRYNRFVTSWERVMELAFHKDPKYSKESEYRFVMIPSREEPGPFRFEIGSIRDIAEMERTKDMYDLIRLDGEQDF